MRVRVAQGDAIASGWLHEKGSGARRRTESKERGARVRNGNRFAFGARRQILPEHPGSVSVAPPTRLVRSDRSEISSTIPR
jgi:hypothetical protein